MFYYLNGDTISPSLYSWFSASKLSQAGGGNLNMSPNSRSANPANLSLSRSFSTSFILYPAGIQAQSVSLLIPQSNRLITVAINHISYGTFKGYDENAIPTNNYSSSDTWMRLGYSGLSKNLPISYGISNQLYFSKLGKYSSMIFYLSLGVIWNIKKYKTNIGLSIDDISINKSRINNVIEKSPLRYNIGVCKKLEYLPLKISIDYLSINNKKNKDYFISGIFSLPKNLSFIWGTSTRKLSQNIKESVIKTIFGSSGVGISYKDNGIIIGYGLYFYGTGGWTNGLDLSINF
ncbi:uncharacterized protein METZ01_LOCUS16680 [marine metagenome]|uniref:DUF5723 domain-containing protein n=1 Tax=marine metagenome TaxID=408172 RepID=A0A381PA22_9ZZZZ